MRVFEHEWETGLAPDEVNFTPGVTAPELDASAVQRLEGRPDAGRRGAVRARWAVSPHGWPACPACALAQDNAIWKPPSGKALLCHQDAAYLDHLDPPNMIDLLDGAR